MRGGRRQARAAAEANGKKLVNRTNLAETRAKGAATSDANADRFAAAILPMIRDARASGALLRALADMLSSPRGSPPDAPPRELDEPAVCPNDRVLDRRRQTLAADMRSGARVEFTQLARNDEADGANEEENGRRQQASQPYTQ